MDSSVVVGGSVVADAFSGVKFVSVNCDVRQVVRCLGVVFDGLGWIYGWIVDTGMH